MGDGDADSAVIEGDQRWRGCHADVYALADDSERARAVALLGKPDELAADATRKDIATWSRWQDEIALLVAASSSEGDALLRLQDWQRRNASDEATAGALYRTTMQADMAGQLFVRVVEAPETLPQSMRSLDDAPRRSYLTMPFEEAIAVFAERGLITPEEFRTLSDDAKQRAFTATGLASQGLVERAYRRLLESLRDGGTFGEFAQQLREDAISLGVTSANPGYLETVYRTNVSSSYNAGRYRQTKSPAVLAARPFVQFRATIDSRTTTVCQSLNGLVFDQRDPTWARLAPPNHFSCRSVIVVRKDPGGNRVTLGSEVTQRPDPGFDSPPAVSFSGGDAST